MKLIAKGSPGAGASGASASLWNNKSAVPKPKGPTKPSGSRKPPVPEERQRGPRDPEKGLERLTQNFFIMLQTAPTGMVDLNAAAAELKIQKRRIYDISCALEGIGLVEKCKAKNFVRMCGNNPSEGGVGGFKKSLAPAASDMAEEELAALRDEIAVCDEQERWLDESITKMERSLTRVAEESAEAAYLTLADVRDAFHDETVIALKAPSGTILEVPDPDDGMPYGERRFQLVLKSHTDPIQAILIANPGEAGA